MTIRRSCTLFGFLFVVLLLLCLTCSPLATGDTGDEKNENSPRLTGSGLGTSAKLFGSELLFKVTYIDDDNNHPEELYLVFDGKRHSMKEIDPMDVNVTDGKDYYVKHYAKKGSYFYYFFASDGKYNVTSFAATIKVEDEIDWHFDIAIAMSIVLLPVIFIIYYLKQLNTNLKNLADQIATHLPLFVEENTEKGLKNVLPGPEQVTGGESPERDQLAQEGDTVGGR